MVAGEAASIWATITVAALLLVTLHLPLLVQAAPQGACLLEYGIASCPHCQRLKEVLGSTGLPFVYIELQGNESNVEEYLWVYENFVEPGCYLRGTCYVPLVVVTIDGAPKAIVVGEHDSEYWLRLIENVSPIQGVLVVNASGSGAIIRNESLVSMLAERLSGRLASAPPESITVQSIIPVLISTSLADSVNPCTFSVYTALLLVTLSLLGKRKAILTALAFIAGVYAGYMALGLGLNAALTLLPHYVVKVVAAAGIVVGGYNLYACRMGEQFKSPVPERLRKLTEKSLHTFVGPVGGLAVGLLASFTLLPCSSGPYIVFIALLSRLRDKWASTALLALYNLIFVVPLVLIAAAVMLFSSTVRKVKLWRSRRLGSLEAISSILLIAVCVYIILAT